MGRKKLYLHECLWCHKTFLGFKCRKFCDAKCAGKYNIRQRINPMHIPEVAKKCSKKNKGRPFSKEHKKNLSIARKGKPLTKKQKEQLKRLHEKNRGANHPKSIIAKTTKKEARCLFEDYKKSHQRLDVWAKSKGTSQSTARGIFLRFFPHEYEDFIELKMDRKTSAYATGRAFEYRVKKYYTEKEYFVLRSPQSKGLADLVALKKGEALLIQCKVSGILPNSEAEKLTSLANSIGAKAIVASRGRASEYQIIIKYLNQY